MKILTNHQENIWNAENQFNCLEIMLQFTLATLNDKGKKKKKLLYPSPYIGPLVHVHGFLFKQALIIKVVIKICYLSIIFKK